MSLKTGNVNGGGLFSIPEQTLGLKVLKTWYFPYANGGGYRPPSPPPPRLRYSPAPTLSHLALNNISPTGANISLFIAIVKQKFVTIKKYSLK